MTEEQARNHPGVLAGTRVIRRNKSKPGGWMTVDKSKLRANIAAWRAAHRERHAASMRAYKLLSDKYVDYDINYNAKRRAARAAAR